MNNAADYLVPYACFSTMTKLSEIKKWKANMNIIREKCTYICMYNNFLHNVLKQFRLISLTKRGPFSRAASVGFYTVELYMQLYITENVNNRKWIQPSIS